MNISQALANKGRFGDTMVAHLSPREAMMLKAMGGAGTRNPKTGLPEFFNNADFLASFGTGEGGYEEFLNSLGSSVPDTSVSTSTVQSPTIVPTPEYINATVGGGSISPEGGQSVYDVAPTTIAYPDSSGVQQQVTYIPSDVIGFDAKAYYDANPDVKAAGVDALQHYIAYGKNEGRGWGTDNVNSPTYNPQKKYEYQPSEDQTWAVPGLKQDTSYNVNVGTGDSAYNEDPYIRDETGKPITSNYKYFSSGDDLYGAGVSKVYQDPTKYYTDMPDAGNYRLVTNPDNSISYIDYTGDSAIYSDDTGIFYIDENGKKTYVNKYDVTGDKVTVGGKTYSVTKGDETKYYTKIATTADLTDPDYSGKYQDLGNVYTQSEWQDVQNGYGWKYRYVNGQIYYAMPGDDITKTGYTGLTQDQVNNAYTYKGKNYWNMNQDSYEHEKYGTYDPGTYENSAWAYDEATGNYYRPVFTGNDVIMKRMLRPGEDSGDSGGLLNIVKYVLPTVVNTAMSMGMGSSILGELAATAGQVGSMAGDAYFAGAGGGGAGLGASAGTAAVPTFTEGIKSGLSSIGDYLASIPSSISSGLSNLSWSSLAPSSLKAVAIPAAVGGGYAGMQSDWDLTEMLKGAGMGALGGYGVDRLLAGLKYLGGGTGGGSTTVSGDYGEAPSEFTAKKGLWDKYTSPYQQAEDWWEKVNPNDYTVLSGQGGEIPAEFTNRTGPWGGGYSSPYQQTEDFWGVNDPNGLTVLSGRAGEIPAEFYDPNSLWKNYVGPQSAEDWWGRKSLNDLTVYSGPAGEIPPEFTNSTGPWAGTENTWTSPYQQAEDFYSGVSPADVKTLMGKYGTIPSEFYDETGIWKDYVGPQSAEDWWRDIDPNRTLRGAYGEIPSEFYDETGTWKDYVGPQSAEDWYGMEPGGGWNIELAPGGGDWYINPGVGDIAGNWRIESYPEDWESMWRIESAPPTAADSRWRIESTPTPEEMNWAIQSGSPWYNDIAKTLAEVAPSILKILGTGGTTETGGTEGTEFPSGSGSASGGYGYTTTDTSSSEGTGGAGRESALAKAKAIAALQAIKDSVNKKFSGQLYYT